jgi:hypothetical protein
MPVQITYISPHTHISRTRILRDTGRVLARLDQSLNATDVIAETRRDGKHVLIEVQRAFSLKRTMNMENIIVRKCGDRVNRGDVLAELKGIFPRVLRSPVSGEVVSIQGGKIIVKIQDPPHRLLSGFRGVVTGIIPDRGVVIENSGAIIQGVWGNGQINQGTLISLLSNPKLEFSQDQINSRLKGKVVLAGHCRQARTLLLCSRLDLKGLILPSMSPSLLPIAERLPFPIILIEGFGIIPLNVSAYEIMAMHENRVVCLFGGNTSQGSGERPEIFIPLEEITKDESKPDDCQKDMKVRIRIGPHAGEVGEIQFVYPEPISQPNGLITSAANVILHSNEQIIIPLVNLDMLK